MAIGGSNRLVTPEELAGFLAIPKKTVYDRWQIWGLTGIKVGKHLRFRERSVEAYLQENTIRTGGR